MRYPLQTLLLGSATALVFFVPALSSYLIYDRLAIASGQWWRLLTGNFVHFSGSHLVYNLVALFIAGTLIESRGYRGFCWLCVAAGAAIGVVLFAAMPDMLYFGGLSGIATAAVVYLCLRVAGETGKSRVLAFLILMLVAAKIALEFLDGASLIHYGEPPPFVPVPLSHAAGAAAALLVFVIGRWRLARAHKQELRVGESRGR